MLQAWPQTNFHPTIVDLFKVRGSSRWLSTQHSPLQISRFNPILHNYPRLPNIQTFLLATLFTTHSFNTEETLENTFTHPLHHSTQLSYLYIGNLSILLIPNKPLSSSICTFLILDLSFPLSILSHYSAIECIIQYPYERKMQTPMTFSTISTQFIQNAPSI